MEGKNIAVLLFGLYYCKKYTNAKGIITEINIIDTNNIKEFLYNLNIKNNIEYYINTTSTLYDDLLKIYFNTNNIIFDNDSLTRPGNLIYFKRNTRILQLIEIIEIDKYDYFIISRIDCIFLILLQDLNINWDKFNISNRCEKNNLFDDNFFIIPKQFINNYKNILEECCIQKFNTHHIYNLYDKYIGLNNIHFIIEGNYNIYNGTPLYIFPRHIQNEQFGFILNKLYLESGYSYNSNNALLNIYFNNNFLFKITNKGSYHWIGYMLYKPSKKIYIQFEILLISDINIVNNIGLKLEPSPIIYNDWLYKLEKNNWITIEYTINNNNNLLNQLLILIFDELSYLEIEIRNFIYKYL